MSNWIQKPFRRPIPIGNLLKSPIIWDIGVPDPITGTGITTEYGPYIDLDPPMDILSGYIIVPGMRLHSPNGISLRGAVELWDDSELLHEEDIATLSAVIEPLRTDEYGLASCSVDWDSDGSFTGNWVALGTPIPAGSGFMHGSGTPGSSGTNIGLTISPFSIPYGATVVVGVEIGDAGGNVLTSVDMSQNTFQAVNNADSTSSAKQLINTVHDISWAAVATQCRCIATVSGYYGGAEGCEGTASVAAISIERIDS